MQAEELFTSTLAHLAPEKALEALTAEQAETRFANAPHSIAELVAHMNFWQDWFLARIRGEAVPMAESASLGWPEVVPGSWPDLRDHFVEGIWDAVEIAKSQALSSPLSPAIDFGPMADYSIQDALVHIAAHNSHHLGQVILLRQLQGWWPPPAGSWTW